MKKIILLIFSILTVALSYGRNGKTVAVAPTLGKSISEDVKSMVQGALEEGIHKSGDFTLVARGESFRQALREFEFQQQSGAVDDKQLTEFGHAAGANIVCYAEVSKLSESLFRIAYKLIEVESSKILNIGSKSVRNGIEGLLDAADEIAKELFGKGVPANTETVSANTETAPSNTESGSSNTETAASNTENGSGANNASKLGATGNGDVWNPDGIEMVYVEGSGKGITATSGFYIGKYEVTQAQWRAVMGKNPSARKGDSLPVESVNWNDVQKFIKKLKSKTGRSYRLPTENEWEFAARGGTTKSFCPNGCTYSGSDNINNVAWYDDNSGKAVHPVGTKQPNELGIYDMSGNVYEWCQDCSASCSSHSIRGGSWYGGADDCRVDGRFEFDSGGTYGNLGFRLVLDLK